MSEVKHIIDCDADQYMPEKWWATPEHKRQELLEQHGIKEWEVIEHRKGGQFEWNLDEIELYQCEEQQTRCSLFLGVKLRKKLKGKPVLNANVLDYLLKHPELIPDEWKFKEIFFWGTTYRHGHGATGSRFLYWDVHDEKWDDSFCHPDDYPYLDECYSILIRR